MTTNAPFVLSAGTSLFALRRENEALRCRLGVAQNEMVKAAIETGDLYARIEKLQADLIEMAAGRDAWRAEAERLVGWSVQAA